MYHNSDNNSCRPIILFHNNNKTIIIIIIKLIVIVSIIITINYCYNNKINTCNINNTLHKQPSLPHQKTRARTMHLMYISGGWISHTRRGWVKTWRLLPARKELSMQLVWYNDANSITHMVLRMWIWIFIMFVGYGNVSRGNNICVVVKM